MRFTTLLLLSLVPLRLTGSDIMRLGRLLSVCVVGALRDNAKKILRPLHETIDH
jgi:hypothetical protein